MQASAPELSNFCVTRGSILASVGATCPVGHNSVSHGSYKPPTCKPPHCTVHTGGCISTLYCMTCPLLLPRITMSTGKQLLHCCTVHMGRPLSLLALGSPILQAALHCIVPGADTESQSQRGSPEPTADAIAGAIRGAAARWEHGGHRLTTHVRASSLFSHRLPVGQS